MATSAGQGSYAGSGGLRKVVAIAGRKKKKLKPKGKGGYTINGALKVRK